MMFKDVEQHSSSSNTTLPLPFATQYFLPIATFLKFYMHFFLWFFFNSSQIPSVGGDVGSIRDLRFVINRPILPADLKTDNFFFLIKNYLLTEKSGTF